VTSILTDLLKFNPGQRLSVKSCLKQKFFDDIRVKELEREAPFRIYLGCDDSKDTAKITPS
jgi:hypothetical protein